VTFAFSLSRCNGCIWLKIACFLNCLTFVRQNLYTRASLATVTLFLLKHDVKSVAEVTLKPDVLLNNIQKYNSCFTEITALLLQIQAI
jgi:hypothetical protein